MATLYFSLCESFHCYFTAFDSATFYGLALLRAFCYSLKMASLEVDSWEDLEEIDIPNPYSPHLEERGEEVMREKEEEEKEEKEEEVKNDQQPEKGVEFPEGKKAIDKIKGQIKGLQYYTKDKVANIVYNYLAGYLKTQDGRENHLELPFVKEQLPKGDCQLAWMSISGPHNKEKLQEFVLSRAYPYPQKYNRSIFLSLHGDETGASHTKGGSKMQKGAWQLSTSNKSGGNSLLG